MAFLYSCIGTVNRATMHEVDDGPLETSVFDELKGKILMAVDPAEAPVSSVVSLSLLLDQDQHSLRHS